MNKILKKKISKIKLKTPIKGVLMESILFLVSRNYIDAESSNSKCFISINIKKTLFPNSSLFRGVVLDHFIATYDLIM